MKKKRRTKTDKREPKPQLPNRELKDEKDESENEKSPFGGMNMENFKKNLGCGS